MTLGLYTTTRSFDYATAFHVTFQNFSHVVIYLPLVCPHISFLPLTGDCDSFIHTRYCLGGEFPLPHFHFILNPPLSPFSFEASSSLSSFISIPGERGEPSSVSEASTSEVSLRERSERLYIHYLHRFISHIHLRPKVQSSFELTFPPLSVLL